MTNKKPKYDVSIYTRFTELLKLFDQINKSIHVFLIKFDTIIKSFKKKGEPVEQATECNKLTLSLTTLINHAFKRQQF